MACGESLRGGGPEEPPTTPHSPCPTSVPVMRGRAGRRTPAPPPPSSPAGGDPPAPRSFGRVEGGPGSAEWSRCAWSRCNPVWAGRASPAPRGYAFAAVCLRSPALSWRRERLERARVFPWRRPGGGSRYSPAVCPLGPVGGVCVFGPAHTSLLGSPSRGARGTGRSRVQIL